MAPQKVTNESENLYNVTSKAREFLQFEQRIFKKEPSAVYM